MKNKLDYIERFVTGHGINFDSNKKNHDVYEQSIDKWAEISSNLKINQNEDSVLMFCGAKNNGKSSLVRYLLNEYNADISLKSERKSFRQADKFAYYVDFDPGQPEMTTPGIVSAHIIRASDQPLTSPTYLNVLKHEELVKSCVGGLNMSVNPRIYIENCSFVFRLVKEHLESQDAKHPIFINTMGFIRGVGLAILFDLIKICNPTNLIVLDMEGDPLRSICTNLDPKEVYETRASFFAESSSLKKLKYQLQRHELEFSFSVSTSVANKNRAALQLANFGTIPEALYKPIFNLTPKIVNLKTTLVHCVSSYPLKPNIVLEILYQSWVHLVRLKHNYNQCTNSTNNVTDPLCNMVDDVGENIMYGCGIVIGIDIENQTIMLVTSLNQETLDAQVNCLIKPLSIQVPKEMF